MIWANTVQIVYMYTEFERNPPILCSHTSDVMPLEAARKWTRNPNIFASMSMSSLFQYS